MKDLDEDLREMTELRDLKDERDCRYYQLEFLMEH